MEKKNIVFENNGNSITMRYQLMPSDTLDDTALDRLRNNVLDMIAPVQFSEADARKVIYSQIPAAVTLSSLMKKPLNKTEVLTIFKNLLMGMDIGKYGIPVSYIVKDADYIYVDEHSLYTYSFVVPVKGSMEVTEIQDFFKNVISNMKFNENDKDNYVARIITNLNSDRFSIQELNVMVNEMLLELGDAELAAMSQSTAKVDKLGVMRNRAENMRQPMQPQFSQPQFNQPMGGFDPMTGQPIGQPMAPQFNQPQGGFDPMTGQPMAPQFNQPMQPQGGFDPMTGQPIGQPMAPQFNQPQGGFDPMTGQPIGQPQAPMGPQFDQPQAPQFDQPMQPMGGFDPMTGQPIGQPMAPQFDQPQAPMGPQFDQPQASMGPQFDQPMQSEPIRRFDPMTGMPIEEPAAPAQEPSAEEPAAPAQEPVAEEPAAPAEEPVAEEPEAPVEEPAAEEPTAPAEEPVAEEPAVLQEPVAPEFLQEPVAPQGPVFPQEHVAPQGPVFPQEPVAPQGPMFPQEPVAPQGPVFPQEPVAPQGPVFPQEPVAPQEPVFPQEPVAPQGPIRRFDPMTGMPLDEPAAPQEPMFPQEPAAPEAPQEPAAPAQEQVVEAPKQDDMFSFDDLMNMENAAEKAEEKAEENVVNIAKPHPHFVRVKTGEKIYIEKDEFKIGKSRIHADYALENNSAISRVHVIIIRRNGVNYLKDNASTNGTFVDGEKLEPGREVLLKNDMHVKFGDEDFIFYLREEAN